MTTASAWILVATPLWLDRPEIVGVYSDLAELGAAADAHRVGPTIRAQDELTAQRWVGRELVEEVLLQASPAPDPAAQTQTPSRLK